MSKLKDLSEKVFEKYSTFDSIFIGRCFVRPREAPQVDICIPWEATDLDEIPVDLREKNPIITDHPDECIDDLLNYFMDREYTFSLPEDLVVGTLIMYVYKDGEVYYV